MGGSGTKDISFPWNYLSIDDQIYWEYEGTCCSIYNVCGPSIEFMDNKVSSKEGENIPSIRDKQHDQAGDDEHKQDAAHDTSEHCEVYLCLSINNFNS